jgi:hypothetical protein
MATDRTTKTLLALIVLALWALVLRSTIPGIPGETPAQAAAERPDFISISATSHPTPRVYVLTRDGRVYSFDGETSGDPNFFSYGNDFGKP